MHSFLKKERKRCFANKRRPASVPCAVRRRAMSYLCFPTRCREVMGGFFSESFYVIPCQLLSCRIVFEQACDIHAAQELRRDFQNNSLSFFRFFPEVGEVFFCQIFDLALVVHFCFSSSVFLCSFIVVHSRLSLTVILFSAKKISESSSLEYSARP